MADPDAEAQNRVDEYFDRVTPYWRDVYGEQGVEGVAYRLRMATVLAWVDESHPAAGTTALDVGCGAGLVTVELARRGLTVEGVDGSSSMLDVAARTASEAGVADRVTFRSADVHALPYSDASFPLIVALGVIPWLHTPGLAVRELSRVLAPGGLIILTADNRGRLNRLTEPRENPLFVPIKVARRRLRGQRLGADVGAPSRLHLPREVDAMLVASGLQPTRRRTVGFGPFTFLGRQVFADSLARRVDRRLQAAADRDRRGVRSAGWHYIVAAQKER
jgi:ubiquinone/menaquinone biosynthesis C-methylase UbiE